MFCQLINGLIEWLPEISQGIPQNIFPEIISVIYNTEPLVLQRAKVEDFYPGRLSAITLTCC